MREPGLGAHLGRVLSGTASGLVLAASLHADPRPLESWLPELQPGTWVKVEGHQDPAGGLRAQQVRILRGEPDESEVSAKIASIDAEHKSFTTALSVQVVTDRSTEVRRGHKSRTVFATLQPGDRVEAEGQLQKDGTLLAHEVEIKSARESNDPNEEDELTGRIETIDVAAHQITLLGITVHLDEKTMNKTPAGE